MLCKGCGTNLDDPKDRAWIDAPFCPMCCCAECCQMEDEE